MKGSAPIVIAIDGPAASGKGTLARRLAQHFGLAHLDTGKLYRATALAVLDAGGDPYDAPVAENAARSLDLSRLGDRRLGGDEIARAASIVAAIPAVRAALLEAQRAFARHPPGSAKGAVLDGRDIGTVVCPDAPLKLYITAGIEARAGRRHKELAARGEDQDFADVLADLEARDARDSARATAPLKQAQDAVLIDTTALDAEGVFAHIADLVEARLRDRL